MNDQLLAEALERALANIASNTDRELFSSVKRGAEKTFQEALVFELAELGVRVSNTRHTLSSLGGINTKDDSREGVIDFVVEEDDYLFAFELKVVGMPPIAGKRGGYNVMQIGQDVMRLTLLDHSETEKGVGGGWIVVLGAGKELEGVSTHDDALTVMHDSLHNEFQQFLGNTNGCIGRFSDARSVGGCVYLGLGKKFSRADRPEHSYFARTVPGSGLAALATWVGWEEEG